MFFSQFNDINQIKSVAIYKNFFDAYELITNSTLNEFNKFFDDYKPHDIRQNNFRKSWAPRYNVFSSLGIYEDECIASKFIASLLDPYGTHDQGPLFLRSFFKEILNYELPDLVANCVRVSVEAHIDEFGRLDILLELPGPEYGFIVIENKINSPESPNQIGKYQKWLERKGHGQCKIVFLTPDGRESITKVNSDIPVIPLSYSRFVNWLMDLDSSPTIIPERIRFVVHQFCELHNKKLVKGVFMDTELESFLSQKLSVAWDISEVFIEMRDSVYSKFWGNVAKFIAEKLQDFSKDWSVLQDFGRSGTGPHCLWVRYKNTSGIIKFGVKMYTEVNKDCTYGIWNAHKNSRAKIDLTTIISSLTQDNFKSNSGKPGYKKLKDKIGIELSYNCKKSLIFMNDDNNSGGTKAKLIADEVTELVAKYGQDLAKLNEQFVNIENVDTGIQISTEPDDDES